ncbi:hinge connector of long tail fiber protein distal connector [Vibrio phage F86]
MYDRLKRDGDYLLIFRHDSTGSNYFASVAEARNAGSDPDVDAKFSALYGLEEFRREDGRFQLKLHYPEVGVTNIWRQSNNFAEYDSGQYLRGTNFANGEKPENVGSIVGTWDIVEMTNPGSSNYILERTSTGSTDQYRFDTPQTRLRANTTYTLSCWVAYENESDHDLGCPLFHSRWYDGSNNPHQLGAIPGEVFEETGNDIIVDGKRWIRRYARFTTPSTLNTAATMHWYMTYGSASPTPTGKQYIANPIITDRTIIKNYPGDYEPDVRGVRGYEAIRIDSTYSSWGGIERNTSDQSLGDGSVGSSSWWFAIGANRANGSGQPGPGQDVQVTELWVYAPVGIIVNENLLESRHFNEGASNNIRLYTRGVADGSSESAECVINETAIFETTEKETSKMHLMTFNADGTPEINNTYRLNQSAERGNFVAALSAITNEYFILVSNGSCYSNADVDNALARFNAYEWRGADYFNRYSYSYSAFGSGQLGIVSERCMFDHVLDGDSVIDVNFESRLTIGATGYGRPIIETTNPPTDARISLADNSVVAGQYLLYKVRAMRDIGESSKACNLRFYNSVNEEVGRQNVAIYNYAVMSSQEFYVQVPPSATTIGIWATMTDDEVDYVQLYKAGFEVPTGDESIQSSLNGLAANNIVMSPHAGHPADDTSWLSAYKSDSNLYADTEMPQQDSGSVYWANQTFTGTEKAIVTSQGSGESMIELDEVAIDPTRAYYVSIWVNASSKDAGTLDLSSRVRDTNGIFDSLVTVTGAASSTYISIDGAPYNASRTDKWILLDGFILPYTYTNEQHQEFMDKFNYYFGVHNPEDVPSRLASKGVGVYRASSPKVYRWRNDSDKFRLRYRDEGSTSASTTAWCLPMVTEVKVASFFENTVTAMDMSLS